MYSIETGEAPKGAIDVSDIDLPARAANLFVAGTDALNRGRRQDAERSLAALRSLQPSAASDDSRHDQVYQGDVQALTVMENQLAALLLMEDGKSKEAIELMKKAVATEDKTAYEFGPPMPPKPAHELLGEILLSLGHPDLAQVQFQLALLRAPKRALSLLGLARSFVQSGNKAKAREVYDELRNIWSRADPEILKALEESMTRL